MQTGVAKPISSLVWNFSRVGWLSFSLDRAQQGRCNLLLLAIQAIELGLFKLCLHKNKPLEIKFKFNRSHLRIKAWNSSCGGLGYLYWCLMIFWVRLQCLTILRSLDDDSILLSWVVRREEHPSSEPGLAAWTFLDYYLWLACSITTPW